MQPKNDFLTWWLVSALPEIHRKDKIGFIKKYFFHPVKRRMARAYLKLLKKFTGITVVAITGSAGKTTTKEMLASILKLNAKVSYSKANIDPVYNIPTTILKTSPGTKYLILEMGVEYPGEMDFYLWLAEPDIALITNIFPTHLEFFGNIEGVLTEKSKLALSLSAKKTVVLNSGDQKLKSLASKLKANVKWFKYDDNPLVQNANAARECAKVLGLSEGLITEGLEKYENPPHRLNIKRLKNGCVILDDSYNSNPWAAMSTLAYFNKLAKGKKIAILGDMLELGEFDQTAHRELGREVAKSGFDTVIGVGKSSKFLLDEVALGNRAKTMLFSSWKEAIVPVHKLTGKNVSVLIKGSRSIGLDKLVDKLS